MSHTPGPWSVSGWSILEDTNGTLICEVLPWNEEGSAEDHANAHLIAAAPELLEALEYAIKQVPELASVPGIEVAIRKARGEEC